MTAVFVIPLILVAVGFAILGEVYVPFSLGLLLFAIGLLIVGAEGDRDEGMRSPEEAHRERDRARRFEGRSPWKA